MDSNNMASTQYEYDIRNQASTVADSNTVEDPSNIYGLQDDTVDFTKFPEFGRESDAPSTMKELSIVQ